MKYTIKVEQRHIDGGIRNSDKHCPVACAIRDTQGLSNPSVGTVRIDVTSPSGDYMNLTLPPPAQDFIREFDEIGRAFLQPFEFELELT